MGLNSQGLNVMDRREIWLFTEGERLGIQGRKSYVPLKWCLVRYGEDPQEFLEAGNNDDFVDTINGSAPVARGGQNAGMCRIIEFRIIPGGRLCDVHSYDDYAADVIGFVPDPSGKTPTGWDSGLSN